MEHVRIVLEKRVNSFILLDTPTMKLGAVCQLENIDSLHLIIDTGLTTYTSFMSKYECQVHQRSQSKMSTWTALQTLYYVH
jgi:hypothetical protein